MALTRKEGKPYNHHGIEVQTAYQVIDNFAKYDKKERQAIYYIDTYASKAMREGGRTNLLNRATESVSSDEFDTYFSCKIMDDNGNQFNKAYEHILTIKESVPKPAYDTKQEVSEKNLENIEVLKYKDWESDEIA